MTVLPVPQVRDIDGDKRLAVPTADMLLLANGCRYIGRDREDDLLVALAEHRLELPGDR